MSLKKNHKKMFGIVELIRILTDESSKIVIENISFELKSLEAENICWRGSTISTTISFFEL